VVFYIFAPWKKEHQIFGIRAIMKQYNLALLLTKSIFKRKKQRTNERLDEGNEARKYKLSCSS
jgi:hypothetical protein